jgi:CxxC motif-containing protein (DUF1111 family)
MRSLKAVVFSLVMLGVAIPFLFAQTGGSIDGSQALEAPGGFDNGTNGCVTQTVHDQDRAVFETVEKQRDGLGPFYNGTSCAGCHSTPISGGVSSITELRAGHDDANGNFIPATAFVNFGQEPIPNRSLIDQKAICEAAQETLTDADNIRALRLTLNVLGDGYVEAIADGTLQQIAANQSADIQGELITDLALEGGSGFGRFGWKDQHVSLLSFASDAYLNEMGISNRLRPNEDDFTHQCDSVPDPEDVNDDIDTFARFMRATKVPPRDTALAATPDAQAGSALFDQIGCSGCHVRTIVTAPASLTANPSADVNGIGVGGSNVPPCLANKTIHPFSDFLLHKLGTGDKIVQDGAPQHTANKIRTPPLWGLRTHPVFMHDGASTTISDAIARHGGQASTARAQFNSLLPQQQQQVLTFLNSL